MAGGGGGGGVVERPWVTVGAIRSTGLTAALGIARHVGRLSYPNHYLTLALTLTLAPALTLTLALALTLSLALALAPRHRLLRQAEGHAVLRDEGLREGRALRGGARDAVLVRA